MARQVSVGSLPARAVTKAHKVVVQTDAGTGLVTLEDAVTAVGAVASIISDNSTFTVSGGTAIRKIKDKLGDVISVKDFGAKGDGTTNDDAALQSCFAYAATLSRSHIHFPPGTYVVTQAMVPPGNCTISGAGMDASKILWSEANNCFDRSPSGSLTWERITIRDLTIEGTWATTKTSSSRCPIYIWDTAYVTLSRVRIQQCRFFGLTMRRCTYVSVSNCHVYEVNRDGISCASCVYVNISNNTIDHCDDDAITAHSFDSEGSTIWRSVVISGNRISDAQGICVLGGNRVSITGNQIERCRLRGIFIGINAPEGYSNVHSVTITGNTINDIFNRFTIDALSNAGDYISVGGVRQPGALAAIPGEPDSSTGAFVDIYTHLQNNGASAALCGAARVTISGNTMGRTLPLGVAYSSYGRGQMFTRNGYLNPTVTAAMLTAGAGIALGTALRDSTISGNVIQGVGIGVYFTGGTNNSYQNISIANNIVSDVATGCVVCASGFTKGRSILVSDNIFDGDPFHAHSNRGAGGTWLVDGSLRAIWVQNGTGFVVRGNLFKNVCLISDVVASTGNNKAIFVDNIIECNPAAAGFSTSNKGVGNVPRMGKKFTPRIVDCDPTSATYGTVLNNCEADTSSIPTTGTYVVGQFVQNIAPVISAGKVLNGWLRVTTGSAHVSGTDWAPVYGTTS